jgi:hypothetical protein
MNTIAFGNAIPSTGTNASGCDEHIALRHAYRNHQPIRDN